MRKYTGAIVFFATMIVVAGTGWAQEQSDFRVGGGVGVGPGAGYVGKPQPPMADYDENMMGANKKMLFDATMSHYMNLLRQSEIAISNSVALSNRQNNDSQFTSHLGQLRTLNAGLLAGANVGASQGRQMTGADVAMSAQFQNSTYATQIANLATAKFAEAINPILIEAAAQLRSVIIEALRNPPPGMSSTGRPPVNQEGN